MTNNSSSIMVHAIRALKDNYIWAITHHASNQVIIVDPGEAAPVHAFLNQRQLKLAAILITHKHGDHCSGAAELKTYADIKIYAPAGAGGAEVTHRVTDQQDIFFPEFQLNFQVIAIPGHTLEHVAYYDGIRLFCGDTLFGAGCGRIFEGTPPQMYASLQRLATLPSATLMYCGHEYTVANLRFAVAVDPHHLPTQSRLEKAEQTVATDRPTLPSTLAEEYLTNPFLRCSEKAVIEAVQIQTGKSLANPIETFAALREWKNRF